MPILIRPAARADVPGILEIYNEAVLNTTASYDYEPHTLEARLSWFKEHEREGFPIFVAEDDGEICGWSSLSRFREKIGYQYSVENSIYIAPQRRNQGIGSLLMPPLIEAARASGKHAILAGVDAENQGSLKFHEKFGFVRVAHFPQVGWKFNRWLDVIFLQLTLDREMR